jgi:hypothetical protein
MNERVTEQVAPVPNGSRPIWELVMEDMAERDRVGRQRYGTPLQAFNGRDALVDAYQEALDFVVYLRQVIAERDAKEAFDRSRRVAILQAESEVEASVPPYRGEAPA